MSNLEHDLIAFGYTPVPLGQNGDCRLDGLDGAAGWETRRLLHRLWL